MYTATLMLLGSGELGREFAIAAKRLGCRMIACDRYANAPAMQVADAFEVFPMLDGKALRAAVEKHKPDVIVPEIEAIDTATLAELEAEGWRVAPSARAVQLTMNRDGIRDFAARELGLVTSKYRFAETHEEALAAAAIASSRVSAKMYREVVRPSSLAAKSRMPSRFIVSWTALADGTIFQPSASSSASVPVSIASISGTMKSGRCFSTAARSAAPSSMGKTSRASASCMAGASS